MMIALYITLTVILTIVLLYLLILVRPNSKLPENKNLLHDYAHRGLHGKKVPENSLQAFLLACDRNFGIELDVQLSADSEVMVFHDYSLKRMTGVDKRLSDLTVSELQSLSLVGTDQKIPTLKEVLELVDGKVPILVELKGESLDASLCPKVAEILKAYKGDYCIESFNPFLIKTMRKYLPNVFYGQLYTNVCRDKKKYSLLNILLTLMAFNSLTKINFIAYNKLDRNSFAVKLTTKLYRSPKFVWTPNTRAEIDTAHSLGEYPIFEIK